MKTIKVAVSVIALALSSSAFAANELVWDAEYNQTQISCGIDYANGVQVGGILTKGESGTDNSKAINFVLTSNTTQKNWRLTEAKLTQGTGQYDFADNLLTVSDRNKTSVFVNNVEYAWTDAAQAQNIAGNTKTLALAPKINLDQQGFAYGVTHIQGKIVLTCN